MGTVIKRGDFQMKIASLSLRIYCIWVKMKKSESKAEGIAYI